MTAWGSRYRAYLRAHRIDISEPVEVRASEVRDWIAAQADLFRAAHPEGLDFDGWLNERFPEPAEAPVAPLAAWGNDREWGF